MAAVAAAASCATATTCLVQKSVATSSSATRVAAVNALPALTMSRLVCSAEKKESVQGLPMLAASGASFAAFAAANPGVAFALVDKRLSTEGTGLGLGLSNPKLAWILMGGTTLICLGLVCFQVCTKVYASKGVSNIHLWMGDVSNS